MSRSPRTKDADTRFATAVAERVAATRKAKGWSQAGLAHELGIEPATLSRYEVAARPFPLPLLARVAALLGVPVADLLPEGADQGPEHSLEDLTAAWEGLDAGRRALLVRIAREMARR